MVVAEVDSDVSENGVFEMLVSFDAVLNGSFEREEEVEAENVGDVGVGGVATGDDVATGGPRMVIRCSKV